MLWLVSAVCFVISLLSLHFGLDVAWVWSVLIALLATAFGWVIVVLDLDWI